MLPSQYKKFRFLVIDDFENFRQIMIKMLRELGVDQINEVANAASAVKFCEQVSFDVILSDYNLGKNTNGQQLLEELHLRKLIKNNSIFIMITAEVTKDNVLTALECQPDGYLAKPFTAATLENRLKRLLTRNEHLNDVLSDLDREDPLAAIQHCDQHIRSSSPYANWCLKTKAELLFLLKDYDGARQVYKKVLASRELDWALLGLGKAHCQTGEFLDAVTTLKKLINNNVLCLAAYDWLAKSFQGLGDPESAQQVIQKALSFSALSVNRQQLFASVCRENNDLEHAAKAYRKIVTLAENSVHYAADNGLNLARCLSDSAAVADTKEARLFAKEALGELKKVGAEFDTQDVTVQTKLVEARVYCATGEKAQGEKTLLEARKLSEDLEQDMSIEMKLEFARSYSSVENKEELVKILKQLCAEPNLDETIASEIDKLLDEPITATGKEKTRLICDNGVAYYKSEKYAEAINEFGLALKQYPNNIMFMLNLATTLISDIENSGFNDKHQKRCQELLARLDYIAEEHKHFEWFQTLDRRFKSITGAESQPGLHRRIPNKR